ncbi:MAG: OmpW family protein [Xanthomonadales bacterium]|jgi:outer membrane protein|uniref:OmpW/AlkL family protein n=1 Tax=Thermomonas sp. TaxID=1971895 RepID=UPI001ACD94C4|nr:OmpW family protein [Xanthomonadales bacterium]HMT38698.1 OmpW family outer membrane protein [Thermomonas sp.]
MKLVRYALAASLALAAMPAFAQSAGHWTLGVGVHNVDPKSDNGTLTATPLGNLKMDIGSNARPTITGEYFLKDNLGVEILAALPFQHDINVVGVGKVGSTKHLPPTVSLQYHFGQGKVRPFVGLGLNYTTFFSTKTEGAIDGTNLDLSNSWGLAGHIGVDFQVSEKGAIRIDYRKIDIDTDVKLNGAKLGTKNTVNIDPSVYGIAYVMHF